MEIDRHTSGAGGAAERPVGVDHRRRRSTELRAAISLVSGAAADLGWGARPDVRVLPDGDLWLEELDVSVSAANVYRAARRLVAAQLRTVAEGSGLPVADVAGRWLLSLQTNEAMVGLELLPHGDDAAA